MYAALRKKCSTGRGSNNNPSTARSFGFVTIGHFNHHKKWSKKDTCEIRERNKGPRQDNRGRIVLTPPRNLLFDDPL